MEITAFLMAGQSNMAGRGDFGEVPPIKNPQCFMQRNGLWQPMTEPINPDRAIFEGVFRSGVGLAASFADACAKETDGNVGLIPCADGGTAASRWMPGEILFDHAVMCAEFAKRTGASLGGLLWHQGENDCHPDLVPVYRDKLYAILTGFRHALGEELPIVLGELYAVGDAEDMVCARAINGIFHEMAKELPRCAVASADGLNLKADGIHFNSASYREFGIRYYKAYRSIV